MKRHARAQQYLVGVDVGGTKILAGVFDRQLRLLAREKKSTKPFLGAAGVTDRIADCINEALAAAAVPHAAVAGLGVGVPGLIDPRGQVVQVAPNLHWHNVPLAHLLSRRLQMPVALVNDVQAGAVAVQAAGTGRKFKHFVCMFIGTGIGGGLVLNGTLYRGAAGLAGEVGHMTVIPQDGPRCGCGNRGCLEAVASRSAIVRRIASEIDRGRKSVVTDLCDGDVSRIRSRIIAEAYREGDKLVRRVIDDACEYLGIGVANLVNVLNPEAVIFGGGLMEALGDRMLPRITRAAAAHVVAAGPGRVRILDSSLGDDAGILGAALTARASAR